MRIVAVGLVVMGAAGFAPGDEPSPPRYPDHTKLLVVRDHEGKETPIHSSADWSVRRDHIRAHVQEVMGPLPGGERRVLLDVKFVETIDDNPAYTRKKLSFASEPGDRVPAWLLIPKAGRGPHPAMLCLHQTVKIGKDEPVGLGGKPNLRYANELAERGYVTLAPDYPGFGEHDVDPYALGYASASMKAIWDNLRAIDLLTSLPEVDPGRIGVIGHSLGGHNAIFTAVFDERLKAVVSSCGFTSFPNYHGGNLVGWSHKGYMPRIREVYGLDPKQMPFDFPELLGAIAPRAFFTNSPTRDANFDVQGVKICISAATDVYKLQRADDQIRAQYPDAEHDFPLEQRVEAYGFLDRVLGPDRTRAPTESRPSQ
ncbi:MAG TPA: alpha/beta fold hydrolase [Isosphaeraceae bacterium]|jgi:pimeloyl-ACP methyl ester carboxylesterase|nr:alpha/beta fold hydrolase [Isosphaeraceae bacterium]